MAEQYEKIEILGEGTFGKAWLVRRIQSSRKYVIKEIKVRLVLRSFYFVQ